MTDLDQRDLAVLEGERFTEESACRVRTSCICTKVTDDMHT